MPKYAPPPGYQMDSRSGLYYSQTVTGQSDGSQIQQVIWFNCETGQYTQSNYAVDTMAGKGKKSTTPRKKRRALPIVLSVVFLLGLCGTATVWLLRPQNKAELLVTTAEENAQYGNLLAAYGEWVFYADPAMGGALCTLNTADKKARPIAVADMAVANLNVVDDTLYFTDLDGSFLSKTGADGSVVNRSFPTELQNLTGYLDVATRSDTLHLGGNLYRADGLSGFLGSKGKEPLRVSVVSDPGSYHYNVVVSGDSIKSVERIVIQESEPPSALTPTSAKAVQQSAVINLSTTSYNNSNQSPQIIQLGVLPPSNDKPKEATLYDKLMDGLGLVYSKVENSFFTETKIERNEAEENYYNALRQELERSDGHQIGNVTQIGDMLYYDTYSQKEDDNAEFTSALRIKNAITGDTTFYPNASDMKRAGDKVFFKDGESGVLMVIDGGSGGQVKAVSSTPIGNYVINSRGDIEFDYVDRQGKIIPGIFSLKDHEAAYRFLKSGAPDTQIDTPYYTHLNPPDILFDNVDDWEKRNSWTGSYARGNLINPFYEDVNMQMAYKMGYDKDGNPVWIQEAWEAGVGKRKETHTFAPAVDVVKGEDIRDRLKMYNFNVESGIGELAEEYPMIDFKEFYKRPDIIESYQPEDGYDWFGDPLPKPLPGKPPEQEKPTEIPQPPEGYDWFGDPLPEPLPGKPPEQEKPTEIPQPPEGYDWFGDPLPEDLPGKSESNPEIIPGKYIVTRPDAPYEGTGGGMCTFSYRDNSFYMGLYANSANDHLLMQDLTNSSFKTIVTTMQSPTKILSVATREYSYEIISDKEILLTMTSYVIEHPDSDEKPIVFKVDPEAEARLLIELEYFKEQLYKKTNS